ncbi:MAG: DUF2842 domain-containing protein [Xanthobacter sp.]
MPQRVRKFIGTVLMLVLVVVWALGAMAISQGRVLELHWALQLVCFALLGSLWVVPAAYLIRWMERPDKRA